MTDRIPVLGYATPAPLGGAIHRAELIGGGVEFVARPVSHPTALLCGAVCGTMTFAVGLCVALTAAQVTRPFGALGPAVFMLTFPVALVITLRAYRAMLQPPRLRVDADRVRYDSPSPLGTLKQSVPRATVTSITVVDDPAPGSVAPTGHVVLEAPPARIRAFEGTARGDLEQLADDLRALLAAKS